jgi:hypothetical protein
MADMKVQHAPALVLQACMLHSTTPSCRLYPCSRKGGWGDSKPVPAVSSVLIGWQQRHAHCSLCSVSSAKAVIHRCVGVWCVRVPMCVVVWVCLWSCRHAAQVSNPFWMCRDCVGRWCTMHYTALLYAGFGDRGGIQDC